ncbi:RNA methylase [Nitzschia inconspicua]|uniref:RNA methylase n=1 Tax=Nitzschia inconspicua TaxID=303405 RepID=A0A9K3M635_9STRA|nr:RNA methylase [Nitzschia inconspicua]
MSSHHSAAAAAGIITGANALPSVPVLGSAPPPTAVPTSVVVVAAAAAVAVTPPVSIRAEDDQQQDGTSIDTFTEYQPTALPEKLIQLYNDINNNDINTVATVLLVEKETVTPKTSVDEIMEPSIVTTTDDTMSSSQASFEEVSSITVSSPPPPPTTTTTTTVRLTVPSHTSSACESALLSSVNAPKVDLDTAQCLLPLLQTNKNNHNKNNNHNNHKTNNQSFPLSPLQLEGVLLAIQRHRRVHHHHSSTSTRAGFFLGDGAGIGKGRQISAIIRDSCCRGRTRHVWLSVSRELVQDAKRDLADVGVHIAVHDGTSFLGDKKNAPGLGRTERGCLFLTYNLLVSTSRLEQIVAWLAGTEHSKGAYHDKVASEQSFGGLIIFDEAHKAKNLLQNTKTAQLVLQLQRRLPNARVVYASATGVSDIAQMAYAERLGLWNIDYCESNRSTVSSDGVTTTTINDGTQFVDFKSFQNSLEQRGLGSMELLALELKTRGCFLARTLSWEGAEFETIEVELDRRQQLVYNNCVAFFVQCKHEIDEAFRTFGDVWPGPYKSQIWRTYWAAHQRFFKELAICAKVPFIAKDALKQINEHGRCVVIGLQSTGDAGMQSLLDGWCSSKKKSLLPDDQRFSSLVSTIAAGLTRFVETHFPTTPPKPEPPKLPVRPPTSNEGVLQYRLLQAEIARIEAMPPPEPNPVLVAKQQGMLKEIPKLGLPPNPLDDLIDRLGGVDHVAEMTGRPGRVVRMSSGKGDYFVYTKRIMKEKTAAVDDSTDRINLVERQQFMDGTKSVAIISDAASTGISLHAANGSEGRHKRRVHYTIELPWSADKAVQQLGRSHRSGQESAPIYKLVVTNLGGERRFAAAVSKRLASLGALTKGDRRAATGSDMSSFDLDSKYGKRALKRLYLKLQHVDSSGVEEPQSASFLPATNAEEVIDDFVAEMKATDHPLSKSLFVTEKESKEEQKREKWKMQSLVMCICLEELDNVGLDRDARSKADVRAFLNRLAGIAVAQQALVFSLFMATLDDVIKEAKTTGEYEGTAEDITATHAEVGEEEVLAIDPSSGVPTKMTTLLLDRGISFELACKMALEEAGRMQDDGERTSESATNDRVQMSLKDDLDGFIVDDVEGSDESEDESRKGDEWMSKTKPLKRAEAGFYISKNKIAGRHLILLAQGKFDYSSFNSIEEAISFDPMRWMQVSRPNTGTSTADMSTNDLQKKYYLACSCSVLKVAMDDFSKNPVEIVKSTKKLVAYMWESAYEESFHFLPKHGLAPRRVKVALVNGPVLHILSALEKAVMFRTAKDKSLKIMRAQVGNRRIVGVRFPHDDDAHQKLQDELEKIRNARQNAEKSYTDEDLESVCPKSQQWTTAERKTITSFFKVTPSSSIAKINSRANTKPNMLPAKRGSASSMISSSTKKTKTMISFFGKKTEYKKPDDDGEPIDLTADD